MKKRVLSMCMAFVLSFSMMPMTAFAEGADAVIEQEVQSVENIVNVSDVEDETEAGGGSDEADTESATDASVSSVQDMIDALPDVDALSAMKEDERNTAYMAVQEAYDAYDALTAEQQAQITSADCFEALFGWFNGQVAPQETGSGNITYGTINEQTGEIKSITQNRNGYQIVDETMTVWTVQADGFYVLKDSDVTLSSLTIQGGRPAYLYLGENTTLTINNSLTFRDGSMLIVYGAPNGSGKIIINNTSDSAAIQADGVSNGSYLGVCSGELEIRSESGLITNGVFLVNGNNSKRYMEYKIDDELVGYTENKGRLDKETIEGKTLTLTWCSHENATYETSGDSQHKINCAQCGFVGDAVDCTFDATNGYASGGEAGHYEKCICGNVNKSKLISHETGSYLLTSNNNMHISGCKDCGYTSSTGVQHTYVDGKCEVCGFEPVAVGDYNYIFSSVKDAIDAVADGKTTYAELYSAKEGKTEITENVVFDYPGKTAELRMNGFTFTNATADPTLSVKSGKLKITGTATINHTGDVSSAAIAVSGGELEFDGDLELNGGLTLTGDAKLTNKLTQGTFRATDGTNVARVSVVGSSVYKNVYDLLEDGYGFYDNTANKFVGGNDIVNTLGQDVTIEAHTHNYQPVAGSDNYQCACGRTCSHTEGYHNDGKCSVCGKPCPHTNVNKSDYTCKDCDKQMLVKIEKDGSQAYSTDFVSTMSGAEDGTTITLLADVQNSGKSAGISGDNKTVTLDLNGHKIIDGWIEVGKSEGYDDYTLCTSCTLKIIGNGSYEKTGISGAVEVQMKATLDLSGWTGGTIGEINIRDHSEKDSEYPVNEREAALIIGPKAGTIQKLWFANNQLPEITKTKLSGGSYGEIYVATYGVPIKLGNLLDKGYAFQNADGTYEEYTKEVWNKSDNNTGFIYNLAVVKCLHDKVEDGTCAYCNTGNIAAVVDDTVYADVEAAISAWQTSGKKLTLYADYEISDATWNAVGERTLDLNGHKLQGGKLDLGSGIDLTIQDNSKYSYGQIGSLKVNNGAKLTLEGGHIASLNVESEAAGDVKLHSGWVKFEEISVPTYKILESGYCLMNGGLTVDPAGKKLSTSDSYRVKKVAATAVGEKSGEITIGESRIPIEISLSVDRSIENDTAQVQFRWYLVKDDDVVQLADSNTIWLSANGSVSYKPAAIDGKEFAEGWKNLETQKTYDLICTVAGKKSDGAYLWHTVLKGYQMTVEKANLDSEKTVITQTANSGNTGHPADNRLVVQPNVQLHSLDDVTYQFDVIYNGEKLTLNTDYTVKANSNTAQNAGEHKLTIVGTGNYTGEKTVTWTIEPYELSEKHTPTQITRVYDGTDIADENVQGVAALGCFEIDSSNLRNPAVNGDSYINLKDCVDKTDLHFDSAEVGDRTFYFTLTLKDGNYVFADGTKTAKFELSRKNAGDPAVSISKESVTAPEAKDVSVVNGHAATYTFDLAGMLPKLDSPMKYGDVQYSMDSVSLDSDYYTTDAAAYIEDGKLKLPILASTQTGDVSVGTITVKVNSDNFHEFILTIQVKASDKIVPSLNGELNLSRTELTYGDQLSMITISGTMTDPTTNETVTGTFAWDTPNQKMDAVGKYDAAWKFVPDNTGIYAEMTGKVTITVIKATPAGEPTHTAITASGKTLSDAALKANDNWPVGTLEWVDDKGNVLSDDTEVRVNTTYQWRFTPTDTNYNTVTGEIELYHVDAPAISAQPESVSVITGERATFEVTAAGTDVTYQWKIDRNDGKGFVDIAGANAAGYTTGVTDKDCDGFKYQCVISNPAGSVTTDTVVLTVKEKYTITATAGEHGNISPNGAVEVVEGSKQTFVITAEEGYEIESLTVDGKSVDTVTSYTFENVTAAHTIAVTFKQQYKIIDGADSSWTQSTDGSGSLSIRGNGAFSKFVNVKVDGTIIDPTNYIVTEGSTIITLKPEFLQTLSEGSHTFEIAWTDGTASTSFTVAKNTSGNDDTGNNDNDDSNKDGNSDSSNNGSNNTAGSDNTVQILTGSPNTGDALGLWINLFLASAAGLAVMLVRRKK